MTTTDLIPTTTLVGMPLMTAEEARATVDRVRRGLDTMRADLLDLDEREGWRALGYRSWRACAAAEFGASVATVYRQLEAAEIERDVKADSQVETSPPIPTQQLQAVKHLPPEQRATAFKRADQLATGRPRTAADVAAAAAELAPLPPLGEPLRHEWVRFRDDGTGQIVMRHQQTAYAINGRDVATLETEARAAGLFLDELATFHWRVFVDVSGDGYTAQHQQFEPIAAPTIERLSLAAWRARLFEDNYPDMPDDVIDALYLQGWRWGGLAWAKGFERIEEDANIDELRFQLGLSAEVQAVAAAPKPAAYRPTVAEWNAVVERAAGIGYRVTQYDDGSVGFTRDSGSPAGAATWADALSLLEQLEAQATTPTTPAATEGWWNCRIELDAIQSAIDHASAAKAFVAAQRLLARFADALALLPTRPRQPRDAGVSAQTKYTAELESYTRALEARLGITR